MRSISTEISPMPPYCIVYLWSLFLPQQALHHCSVPSSLQHSKRKAIVHVSERNSLQCSYNFNPLPCKFTNKSSSDPPSSFLVWSVLISCRNANWIPIQSWIPSSWSNLILGPSPKARFFLSASVMSFASRALPRRGMIWTWEWGTVCPASDPESKSL